MVTNEKINEIIEKTDMVELVSEFVTLTKTGANYKGLCPFHSENTPSFVVSPEKKIATCFGCNDTYSPIKFIEKIKNIPFAEALKFVASRAGVKVDITSSYKNKEDFTKYYKITEIAQKLYTDNLFTTKSGMEALDYLHKRGLDDETIKTFGIGLARAEKDVLYRILKDLNILSLDMIDTGLVKSNEGSYYDLFIKRITFPLKDVEGNILGYSGRIFNTDDKNQPKYINSPESIIYKKHLNLYNINNAVPEIRKMHRVILHEGQMDVIASYRAGFKECVCSLGTALTKEQALLIKKYTNDVIICYDADKAGINASLRAIDILKNCGLNVKLCLLKGAKDPDEFILKYGLDSYKSFFNNNIISEVEYRFNAIILSYNINDISEFEKIKKEVFMLLSKERSQTLVERFLTKLSELANISYSSLMLDYTSYSNIKPMTKYVKNDGFNNKNFDNALAVMSKYSLCELRLFKYATLSKDKALYIDKNINIQSFESVHQSLWMLLIDKYYNFYDEYKEDTFLNMISGNTKFFKVYTSDIETLLNTLPINYNDDDLKKCIDVFNEISINRDIISIDNKIKNETDSFIKIKLLQDKINLMKIIDSKRKKE